MSDLKELVTEYWDLKKMSSQISTDLNEVKSKIMEATGCVSGKLQEDTSFDKKSIEVGDEAMSKIVNYTTSRAYPDWKYLESILTPEQMKLAKKKSTIANMKITSPIFSDEKNGGEES